ncbi:MAG: anthranilate synthase component I [candidate division Zixibacteria bacterium]|nr:anthranilate synthase component I [candidate division Zixibacteria bacterium]MBU1470245.1 anthranilate synthase component I [candidate division Zixibacteria bacterium]MBU2626437.1 anthranilate synthase component I [candidate division Zixibacteria bacterium]
MNLLEILKEPESGKPIELDPTVLELPGDLETPVSAYLKLESVGAKFLLESAESPKSVGRYTFIGISPTHRIDILRDCCRIEGRDGKLDIPHASDDAPFTALRQILARISISRDVPEMRLLGGLVGYAGYNCVSFFEPRIPFPDNRDEVLGSFYLVDTLLVFDHFSRRIKVISLTESGNEDSLRRSKELIDKISAALHGPVRIPQTMAMAANSEFVPNMKRDEFENMVEEARKNIFAGNVFQIVTSQVFSGETGADSFQIYRALRMLNPSPYMFYLKFDDLDLIGSSPEALVKLEDGRAILRPIAGTRRRGHTEEEDAMMSEELAKDEKELAEHVMLVDLGRNDLGRICKYGSVTVPEFKKLEYYSHVIHLTSTVTGKLRDDADQFDLFRAAFPAGTVTGAPKVRAMELINEFEPTKRGPYAGSVGYFSLSGNLDMCIAIRTIIKRGRQVSLQAGAGIVADSVPNLEYKETLNKIAAIKEAIRIAEEGF